MTLPTIIIASRAALKSVPPSIREAALGMGASRMQTITHHVLPLAMPGMLTGTIIGMAQALGESAPLLMIGMVAFIVDIPGGPLDPSTVLPVQIFLWADSPERAFVERTSAAIMVLLAFLITMNALAVILRRRFERPLVAGQLRERARSQSSCRVAAACPTLMPPGLLEEPQMSATAEQISTSKPPPLPMGPHRPRSPSRCRTTSRRSARSRSRTLA